MDGFWYIIAAWAIVIVISYYFIIYRRSVGPKVPQIKIDDGNELLSTEAQKNFANDILNWLVWGGGTGGPSNLGPQQKLVLSPVLTNFVLQSLNEASQRFHNKEALMEVHFERIQLNSKEPLFRNIQVVQNKSSENYLSIHTQMIHVQRSETGGGGSDGIRLEISVPNGQDGQQKQLMNNEFQMRKIPMVKGPNSKRYLVAVEELYGDIETRLATIAGELFVISCFKDRPRVKLQLMEEDKNKLSSKAEEDLTVAVKKCIISAVLNFSIGELLYPDTADAHARASRARLSTEYRNLSFLHELYPPVPKTEQSRSTSPKFPVIEEDNFVRPEELAAANRLNIQLIKIYGANFGTDRPFVCIEMDEPSQRFLSIKAQNPPNQKPNANGQTVQWEQNKAVFEFVVSPVSNELLFEVFAEDEPQPQQQPKMVNSSTNTIRERKFCGTGILSVGELRQAVLEGRANQLELSLHGRPFGYGDVNKIRNRRESPQKDAYGVLVIKASFHTHQEIERPSAPQPTEMGAVEYAKLVKQQQRKSPSPFAYPGDQQQPIVAKKVSTTTNESTTRSSIKRGLTRQKQHYIYNVNDDHASSSPYDRQYTTTGSSSSPDPLKTTQLLKPSFEYDVPSATTAYPPTNGHSALRKTISDTNAALFQFNGTSNKYEEMAERKKSAPDRTMSTTMVVHQERHVVVRSADSIRRKEESKHELPVENEVNKEAITKENQNQDPYDQLIEKNSKQPEKVHPAMGIFEMPDKLKRMHVGEDPKEFKRIARETDRRAGPKKRERSFFDKVRARLAGPVKLLPGMYGKRAKSYDDYESRRMEEAASLPASRDQSQTRFGQRKGSQQFEPPGYQLFVNTTDQSGNVSSAAGSTQSTINLLHSPKSNALEQNQSLLVLELISPEEERPRYYSIPPEVEAEPAVNKLMQSGKKLHIYEGHIFVAVKPRGRAVCAICDKRIGSNFSTRQAYQCRDCRMACHKSCHQRTSWVCTSSSVFNMSIEEVDWPEFLRHNQLREFISSVGL